MHLGRRRAQAATEPLPDEHVTPHPYESGPRPGVDPLQRIVLLGFMCSGKSSVADSLARRLDWRYLDFDVEIERREGRSVAAIIDGQGEEYFRSLEAALTEEVAQVPRIVLAPGGGWITQPGLLELLRPGTLAVWLRVSPEETVRRLFSDDIDRPLRDHPEPEVPIREMLAEREPLYRLADLTVPGDGRSVEEVAFEIEQLARTRGARSPRWPDGEYEE
jgi:shikimate kinase